MRARWLTFLLPLCLAVAGASLTLSGCRGEIKTFAGFTFGGGGKTHNCEPATWTITPDGFELKSGTTGGETAIRLAGKGTVKLGKRFP